MNQALNIDKLTALNQPLAETEPMNQMGGRQRQAEEVGGLKRRLEKLFPVLRMVGAVVIIASALSFLAQQWSGQNHVMRYFGFLIFTAMLPISAFICGLRLRESKGARTFMLVAAAIIPVNFLQLGAFLYSRFASPAALQQIPWYFQWNAPGTSETLLTTGIGLAVLIPICALAFYTLVRSEAKSMCLAYIATNAVLLIPTREPRHIGTLLLAMGAARVAYEFIKPNQILTLRTFEGRLARALLALPIIALIGRSCCLYSIDSFLLACILTLASTTAYVQAKARNSEGLRAVGTLLGMAGWVCFATDLVNSLSLSDGLQIPLVMLPLSAILSVSALLSRRYGDSYSTAATSLTVMTVTAQLFIYPSFGSSLLCIILALAAIVAGCVREQKSVFLIGLAGLGAGILYHMRYAIELYSCSPWISLAVLGVIIVVATSALEKNAVKVSQTVTELRHRIEKWR